MSGTSDTSVALAEAWRRAISDGGASGRNFTKRSPSGTSPAVLSGGTPGGLGGSPLAPGRSTSPDMSTRAAVKSARKTSGRRVCSVVTGAHARALNRDPSAREQELTRRSSRPINLDLGNICHTLLAPGGQFRDAARRATLQRERVASVSSSHTCALRIAELTSPHHRSCRVLASSRARSVRALRRRHWGTFLGRLHGRSEQLRRRHRGAQQDRDRTRLARLWWRRRRIYVA